MDSNCVSETTLETTDDPIAGHPFFGKKRLIRELYENDISGDDCLNDALWSRLPEELLVYIFARLPVKDILRIPSLSKSWRSTIMSPRFQQAFADASLVRIALMFSEVYDGTMFLTQENEDECSRFGLICRQDTKEVKIDSKIAATSDGLICFIEEERRDLYDRPPFGSYTIGIRVFVSNVVTGLRRELPPPRNMFSLPRMVRMATNVVEGGYIITFIYTEESDTESELDVSSWAVYDSVKNSWREDDAEVLAHLKDVDVFNMDSTWDSFFYDDVATFHKDTKVIKVLIFRSSMEYTPDSNGHVHNVSGELYKLCVLGGQHGVWRLTCSGRWEMICECPEVEDSRARLQVRVMNDWVVLVVTARHSCEDFRCGDFGTFVKVFHMPTKSWHNFPEENYFVEHWGHYTKEDHQRFLVEVRFDAIPWPNRLRMVSETILLF